MAKQTWTVSGRILFQPQFTETREVHGDRVALPGVRVQVSAKESKLDPTWGEWHDGFVGKQGRFSFTIEKDGTPRYFRVRVLFKDDTLKLYPPPDGLLAQLTEAVTGVKLVTDLVEDALEIALSQTTRLAFNVRWFTVLKDEEKSDRRGPGVVDLGDIVFRPGGRLDLGDRTARRHADIWWFAKQMMALLDDMGHGFPEKRPPAIIHPWDSPLIGDGVESSYANVQTDVVHLVENSRSDHFNAASVAHEFMHLWAYQHSTGEKGLAWQLLIHGSTHDGRQEKTWVAFHEAFAEWAGNRLYTEIYDNRPATIYNDVDEETGTRLDNRALPFSRRFLSDVGIGSLSEVDHFEYGWVALFSAVLCDPIEQLDPDTDGTWAAFPGGLRWNAGALADGRDVPALADVLRAFDAAPAKGYPDVISKKEMTRVAFLRRLLDISPVFTEERRDRINELLDTAARPTTGARRPGDRPEPTPERTQGPVVKPSRAVRGSRKRTSSRKGRPTRNPE